MSFRTVRAAGGVLSVLGVLIFALSLAIVPAQAQPDADPVCPDGYIQGYDPCLPDVAAVTCADLADPVGNRGFVFIVGGDPFGLDDNDGGGGPTGPASDGLTLGCDGPHGPLVDDDGDPVLDGNGDPVVGPLEARALAVSAFGEPLPARVLPDPDPTIPEDTTSTTEADVDDTTTTTEADVDDTTTTSTSTTLVADGEPEDTTTTTVADGPETTTTPSSTSTTAPAPSTVYEGDLIVFDFNWVAVFGDLDCRHFDGPVDVSDGDPFGLDVDGDGVGCEPHEDTRVLSDTAGTLPRTGGNANDTAKTGAALVGAGGVFVAASEIFRRRALR